MRRRLTPQESKIKDYENDRRNAYGGNDKNSRVGIRKRKRWVNRAYRKTVKNLTHSNFEDATELEGAVNSVQRHKWKKYPDALLVEDLDQKWSGSSRSVVKPHTGALRKEAIKRLKKSKSRLDL